MRDRPPLASLKRSVRIVATGAVAGIVAVVATLYLIALFGSGNPIRIEYVVISPYIGTGITIENASTARIEAVRVSIADDPPRRDSKIRADNCKIQPGKQAAESLFDCGNLEPGATRTFFIGIPPDRLHVRITYKGGSLTAAYHKTGAQAYSRDYYFGVPLP